MMKHVAILLALVSLAACGRVGPPRVPGPPDRVVYPRLYPARDTPAPANALPGAVLPPVPMPLR